MSRPASADRRRGRDTGRPPSRDRRPAGPPAPADPRRAAYDVLAAVSRDDAYANLVLPNLLRERGIVGRDAAFATELAYGALRARGVLDLIVERGARRPVGDIDPRALDVLRLGAYQLLRTRVAPHAAVDSSVDLARSVGAARAAGFVNAVLRRVAERDWDAWVGVLGEGQDRLGRLALRHAHPRWIAAAFADALGEAHDGGLDQRPLEQTEAALAADDARPATHLVAWPGRIEAGELAAMTGGACAPQDGIRSPYAVRMSGGDPGRVQAVRDGRAAVQDEGSQLCALALADAPLDGSDRSWLDMCAGPGGKAALLGALAAGRGATVLANELHPHRAQLIRDVLERAGGAWPVQVRVGDARTIAGQYDRVLLDAPCTGLGALRRRPEARWRRGEADLAELAALQRHLLRAAIRLTRPGGVVAYVVCSPHPLETRQAVADVLGDVAGDPAVPGGVELLEQVQLWPHIDGTDAMYRALLRRR